MGFPEECIQNDNYFLFYLALTGSQLFFVVGNP
jgi:hypothetical protein